MVTSGFSDATSSDNNEVATASAGAVGVSGDILMDTGMSTLADTGKMAVTTGMKPVKI
jgi:hypothetical protein